MAFNILYNFKMNGRFKYDCVINKKNVLLNQDIIPASIQSHFTPLHSKLLICKHCIINHSISKIEYYNTCRDLNSQSDDMKKATLTSSLLVQFLSSTEMITLIHFKILEAISRFFVNYF